MKLNTTTDQLLELLYTRSLDKAALSLLNLPGKNAALSRLIQDGMVLEDKIQLPEGVYTYYDLTAKGELFFETSNYLAKEKKPERFRLLVWVGSIVAVLSIALLLAFLYAHSGQNTAMLR